MMIFAHFTRSLRETFPARASEWALAVIMFNWYIVLHVNDDLFETGATYHALAGIMAQSTWATLCLIVGGGRLIVLAINGAWRRSPHTRAFCAFVSALFWFEISIGAFQGGAYGTGLAVYPVLFILDTINVLRSTGEAGLSDANHAQRVKSDGTDA
jgi:hypothetical protein